MIFPLPELRTPSSLLRFFTYLFIFLIFINPGQLFSEGFATETVRSLEPPSYRILSADSTKPWLKNLRVQTDDLLREIRDLYGLEPDPFTIRIAGSAQAFRDLLHPEFPHWGLAAAKYSESLIVLKSPELSRQDLEEYRRTLAHELMHLAILPKIRGIYFPRWMNEGLAQSFAGPLSFNQKIQLGHAVVWGDLIRLSKVDEVLHFDQRRANLAYAQSQSAFNWLIDEFGMEKFIEFLGLLPHTYYDQSLQDVYGFDEELFDISWRKWAETHYRPYVLLDTYSYLWALAPVLVMAAWWRKKRYSRRRFSEWDQEEALEEALKNDSRTPN